MSEPVPPDFHSVKVTHITEGYQATCSCGWRGSIAIQFGDTSGRTCFIKARDEGEGHWDKVQKQRESADNQSSEPKS